MPKIFGAPAARLAGAVLFFALAAAPAAFSGSVPNFSPLFRLEDAEFSPQGKDSVKFLGPVGEWTLASGYGSDLKAFRPLMSMEGGDADFVWPLSGWRGSWHSKHFWAPLFFNSFDDNGNMRRLYVIPLWLSGREDGEFFWGVFPLYGDLRKFFSYDKARFVMFPLYWSAEKGAVSGQGYIWPLVNWDTAPDMEKLRVLPFFALNRHFNEYIAESYFWPLFHRTESLNEKRPGGGWMLWPAAGHLTRGGESSWSFVWPVFQTFSNDKGGFGLNCPWPLFKYRSDLPRKGDFTLYFFPLAGYSSVSGSKLFFAAWPCVWRLDDSGAGRELEWNWELPLYWSKVSGPENSALAETYRHFWPFGSYYSGRGKTEVRVLDLCPLRDKAAVNRNYAPFWTLYSFREDWRGSESELFWGMAASSSRGSSKKFSAAFFFESERRSPDIFKGADGRLRSFSDSGAGEDFRKELGSDEFFCGLVKISGGENRESATRILWLLEF